MAKRFDPATALRDPETVFGTPENVLSHRELTREQKIEILRRWHYDASEVAVAEEEGMTGGRPPILHRVLLALEKLTGGSAIEHPSPTKQGGV